MFNPSQQLPPSSASKLEVRRCDYYENLFLLCCCGSWTYSFTRIYESVPPSSYRLLFYNRNFKANGTCLAAFNEFIFTRSDSCRFGKTMGMVSRLTRYFLITNLDFSYLGGGEIRDHDEFAGVNLCTFLFGNVEFQCTDRAGKGKFFLCGKKQYARSDYGGKSPICHYRYKHVCTRVKSSKKNPSRRPISNSRQK